MTDRVTKPSWSTIAKKSPKASSPPRDTAASFPPLNSALMSSSREKFNWADEEKRSSSSSVDVSCISANIEKLEAAVKDQSLVIHGLKEELTQTKSETDREIRDLNAKLTSLHQEQEANVKIVTALQGENADLREELSALASRSKTSSNVSGEASTHQQSLDIPLDELPQCETTVGPEYSAETVEDPGDHSAESNESAELSPKTESVQTNAKPSDTSATNSSASNPMPATNGLPVFVTPETIKKVSPVPPPKKLIMGIDMSRFGKKRPASPPQKASSVAKAPSNNDKDSNIIPAITPGKDMRTMSPEQRWKLGRGRKATVLLGSKEIGTVPMGMFMQCSETANKHFTEHPVPGTISFPEGSMTVKAASAHLEWMNEHTRIKKVWSIQMSRNNPDRENLEIVRAARVMGIHNMYVGHFTRNYCDLIRDGKMPSYELMHLIVELAYPDNDPIFDCLAANLVHHRKLNAVPKPAELDKFLEGYEILAARIRKAEKHEHSGPRRVGGRGSAGGKPASSN